MTNLHWEYHYNKSAKAPPTITPEEFIRRLSKMFDGPINAMRNCEGDLFMSDFRELMIAAEKLDYAVIQLDEKPKAKKKPKK